MKTKFCFCFSILLAGALQRDSSAGTLRAQCLAFNFHGVIVLYCWNYRGNELEEKQQVLVNARLATARHSALDDLLHDSSVSARMDVRALNACNELARNRQ
jgi:hypothetical protein